MGTARRICYEFRKSRTSTRHFFGVLPSFLGSKLPKSTKARAVCASHIWSDFCFRDDTQPHGRWGISGIAFSRSSETKPLGFHENVSHPGICRFRNISDFHSLLDLPKRQVGQIRHHRRLLTCAFCINSYHFGPDPRVGNRCCWPMHCCFSKTSQRIRSGEPKPEAICRWFISPLRLAFHSYKYFRVFRALTLRMADADHCNRAPTSWDLFVSKWLLV